MAKINTLNYQTVASWNGSQDLFVVEQPDGTKVATPNMLKQFIADSILSYSEFSSNNITINRMGNLRILTFNRATYANIKAFYAALGSEDKPATVRFTTVARTNRERKYVTIAFIYIDSAGIHGRVYSDYNANITDSEMGDDNEVIGEFVYTL